MVIQLHASKNTLTVSSASIPQDQPLTLVATLQGDASVPPSGTVVFSSEAQRLAARLLNASGSATLTVTPALGTYNIIATNQSDSLYTGSASSASAVQVVESTHFTVTLDPPTLQLQSTQQRSLSLALVLALLLVATSGFAGAQAEPTAVGAGSRWLVGGTYSYFQADYGKCYLRGGSCFVDYALHQE